ncbi:hypothetical protein [Plesiomonas shigelloides]|uniref:hypothetical protein n=1 Tax=Plesiomonas shigelloides TaxID=703 RepID=UPI003EBB0CFC
MTACRYFVAATLLVSSGLFCQGLHAQGLPGADVPRQAIQDSSRQLNRWLEEQRYRQLEQGQVKQTGSAAVLTDNQGHKDEASWKADIANSLRRLFGGKDSESKEKLPVSGQYQPTDSVTHSSITEGKAQS